jgi:hypothetical protein
MAQRKQLVGGSHRSVCVYRAPSGHARVCPTENLNSSTARAIELGAWSSAANGRLERGALQQTDGWSVELCKRTAGAWSSATDGWSSAANGRLERGALQTDGWSLELCSGWLELGCSKRTAGAWSSAADGWSLELHGLHTCTTPDQINTIGLCSLSETASCVEHVPMRAVPSQGGAPDPLAGRVSPLLALSLSLPHSQAASASGTGTGAGSSARSRARPASRAASGRCSPAGHQ